jgi:hypothetical protein
MLCIKAPIASVLLTDCGAAGFEWTVSFARNAKTVTPDCAAGWELT